MCGPTMRGRAAERTENTPTGPIFLRVLAKIRRDSAKLIVAQARSDALAGLSGTRALTLLFTLYIADLSSRIPWYRLRLNSVKILT